MAKVWPEREDGAMVAAETRVDSVFCCVILVSRFVRKGIGQCSDGLGAITNQSQVFRIKIRKRAILRGAEAAALAGEADI